MSSDLSPRATTKMLARYRLGFDIGGTFTDLALHDRTTGSLHLWKRLSTPSDPATGALAGIEELLDRAGIRLPDVGQVVHGTTIGANTVIERKGARTGLLATEGFRDLLVMQRPRRYSTYDIWYDKHEPLVPRRHVQPVRERMAYDGSVIAELDDASARRAVAELRDAGVESIAICLLHAYANGEHERRLGALVQELMPDIALSLSHEVAPVIGEYERTSTTVVNAYIRPAFRQYLGRLEHELAVRGFVGEFLLEQGNGGLTTPAEIERVPIRALESGPAAGVSVAAWIGRGLGRTELVAFDMGGTTAKACLIEGGTPRVERSFEVDQTLMRIGTGLPVSTPTVDLIEIGAGGGSIARIALGIIEVGPESAGADPGPACYRAGGERPTVTDANIVLGYLNSEYFLSGKMVLDVEASRRAISDQIADPLGFDVAAAAWGIHEAVTANMEHALRSVSIERGRDPRDLTLVAFGGAGPTHAARLARSLGIPEVIFPAAAGTASAVGLLQAAPRVDMTRSLIADLDEAGIAQVRAAVAELDAIVIEEFARVRADATPQLTRKVDMQYIGQGHVIEIELPRLDDGAFAATLAGQFDERYAETFGYANERATPRIVAVSVAGGIGEEAFALPANDSREPVADPATRPVYFPETSGYVDCAVYRRDLLPAGFRITGPAVVEDGQCGILLLPGDSAVVDGHRHVLAQVATSGPSS